MAERDDQGAQAGARRGAVAAARPGLLLPDLLLLLPALHAVPDVAVGVAEPVRGPGVQLALGQLLATRSRSTATSSSGRSCTRCSATLLALVIAYPLAYVIAFRGGRFKNVLLGLVVVPFFTNFLIRTLAWKTILGDQGTVVGAPARRRDPRRRRGTLLRTPIAVIGGLTYNFLPFMVLPIYVALEKIDPRLHRRGARPVLEHLARVPQGRVPAVAAGRVRREPARVHPGRRRLRERVLPRQRRTPR